MKFMPVYTQHLLSFLLRFCPKLPLFNNIPTLSAIKPVMIKPIPSWTQTPGKCCWCCSPRGLWHIWGSGDGLRRGREGPNFGQREGRDSEAQPGQFSLLSQLAIRQVIKPGYSMKSHPQELSLSWFAWRLPQLFITERSRSPNEAFGFIKALFASSLPCKSKILLAP